MNAAKVLPGIDTAARIAATCILGAGIETAMAWRFGWSSALPAFLALGAASAVVTITDLATRKIPEAIVLPSYPLAAALLAVASVSRGQWWALARGGIAMAALGGFYLAIGLAFPTQFGVGDIQWAGVIGLFLGWLAWPAVVTGTLLAFVAAALAVMVLRIAGRAAKGLALPMAPFMNAGALVAIWALR